MQESRILAGLNPLQEKAVTEGMNNLLVLAGAGSGKTRVLVCRIAWLIHHHKLSPNSILAVTFTNKAANEMKERLGELLMHSVKSMWVGTFHGLAHRLLRLHYDKANLPENFQILDSDDQLRMIKRVSKSLNLDDESYPAKEIQWFINSKKDDGLRANHLPNQGKDFRFQTFVNAYREYEQACQRAGVIDFAEILLRTHELLLNDKALLAHYQMRFSSILVDEFQDTNAVQYAFIRLLSSKGSAITVVGDDDQSIYGWRGAKIENIHRFAKDFSPVTTIRLEQNYRSTANILQASNTLIEKNASRLGKTLWTKAGSGDKIKVYAAFNEVDEARFVVDSIRQKTKEEHTYQDVAILYRSNAQSRVLEEAFLQEGMPYRIYGGLRFFERAEIKDAMAYLRLVVNPKDDSAFERVVNFPTRGIGEKTLTHLRGRARHYQQALWISAKETLDKKELPNRAHNALAGFVKLMEAISEYVIDLPLDEATDAVIKQSGLLMHYQQLKGEKAKGKVENLEELVVAASQFADDDKKSFEELAILPAFISHAQLEAGEKGAGDEENAVSLMTMHAAKGLEFQYVFMVGVEEPLFPSQRSIAEPDKLEEERRLCYVAMTRARKALTISYAESRHLYGRVSYHQPSRFLLEISPELLEEATHESSMESHLSKRHPGTYQKEGKRMISDVDKSDSGFSLGERVSHPVFGEGVITNFEGMGESARVEVKFLTKGCKWLVLAYAKLTPLSTSV